MSFFLKSCYRSLLNVRLRRFTNQSIRELPFFIVDPLSATLSRFRMEQWTVQASILPPFCRLMRTKAYYALESVISNETNGPARLDVGPNALPLEIKTMGLMHQPPSRGDAFPLSNWGPPCTQALPVLGRALCDQNIPFARRLAAGGCGGV